MNGGAYFYRNFVGLSTYYRSIYALDMLGWGLSSRPDLSVSNLVLSKSTINKVEKEQAIVQATEDFFVESIEAWRKANNINKFTLAGDIAQSINLGTALHIPRADDATMGNFTKKKLEGSFRLPFRVSECIKPLSISSP